MCSSANRKSQKLSPLSSFAENVPSVFSTLNCVYMTVIYINIVPVLVRILNGRITK